MEILRKNHVALVYNLDARSVLPFLRDVMTLSHERQCLLEKSSEDMARYLVDTLRHRGPDAVPAFINALVATKQHGLAKLLDPTVDINSELPVIVVERSVPEIPNSGLDASVLMASNVDIIRKNRVAFVLHLDVKPMLPLLRDVLPSYKEEECLAQNGAEEMARYLLDTIPSRGPDAVSAFKRALIATNQHGLVTAV